MSWVDVLDAITRAEGQARMLAGLAGDPHANRLLKDLAEARAAIAELIEADEEVDEAEAECAKYPGEGSSRWLANAKARRATALSRVRGAE
ncbi:hypothetical protein [Stenotrophomonas sp. UBA7606]|uniref:hypothetical protein n=1 Tax=Stenotrophomonas sp. UBA7606 TaxID=1947559 RepID=UPI0025DE5203|nr:hypothetical protein [Stenotrophomonas sp. UBA7606]